MTSTSTLLYRAYSATALIREQLLVTIFGYKSHCKHHPTCSRYTLEMIQQKGLVLGLVIGARRLMTCW